jgi:hypothetical protein
LQRRTAEISIGSDILVTRRYPMYGSTAAGTLRLVPLPLASASESVLPADLNRRPFGGVFIEGGRTAVEKRVVAGEQK